MVHQNSYVSIQFLRDNGLIAKSVADVVEVAESLGRATRHQIVEAYRAKYPERKDWRNAWARITDAIKLDLLEETGESVPGPNGKFPNALIVATGRMCRREKLTKLEKLYQRELALLNRLEKVREEIAVQKIPA